ncbi:MAG: hypothetical protein MUF87_18735 [Anaerolineae bacterium]|jgi:hypothetical protein|nr:hypothetical protein [Anaerolineae bacterium]
MSIQTYWGDTGQSILLVSFEGAWVWDEVYFTLTRAEQPHRVDLILDFRLSGRIPPHAAGHLRALVENQPTNVQLVVFVTTGQFMVVLLRALMQVSGILRHKARTVSQVDDALQLIERERGNSFQNHYRTQPLVD